MKKTLLSFLRMCAIGLLLFACIGNSYAQLHENAANCNELKDPDVMFQMDLCKAHVGCRMVMGIHSTCVKAKKFFTNLKEQIGEGVKGLFGYRKEVTSDMVFEASMDDKQRAVEQDKKWKDKADSVREAVKKANKDELTGKTANGLQWQYIGDVKDGLKNGKGTLFSSDGDIRRGEFIYGVLHGVADVIQPNGGRSTALFYGGNYDGEAHQLLPSGDKYIGNLNGGKRHNNGTFIFSDGSRYEGEFRNDNYHGQGVMYRADGSVLQRGIFDTNELSVGKKYNAKGDVIAEVNKPLDEQNAREAEQMAEAAKQRQADAEKMAAAQRQRDAKSAAERAYRDSLAQLNAGQLFAKADELSSAGDSSQAREVLRTLVSRFPDHPLAATAAQQMAGMGNAGNAAAASGNTGGQAGGRSAGGGADLQISCTESFEPYLRTLPNFTSSSVKSVVNNTRNDARMLLQESKAGKITPQYVTEYQRLIREMRDSGRTALENYEKLSMAGRSQAEICNPAEGSQGVAWASTQIGGAFFTWALNVARCSLGQNGTTPIPAFCQF